jgi:hypothetical protein
MIALIGRHDLAPRLKPRFRRAFLLAAGTSWAPRHLAGQMCLDLTTTAVAELRGSNARQQRLTRR